MQGLRGPAGAKPAVEELAMVDSGLEVEHDYDSADVSATPCDIAGLPRAACPPAVEQVKIKIKKSKPLREGRNRLATLSAGQVVSTPEPLRELEVQLKEEPSAAETALVPAAGEPQAEEAAALAKEAAPAEEVNAGETAPAAKEPQAEEKIKPNRKSPRMPLRSRRPRWPPRLLRRRHQPRRPR